jgi:hypothetical protein
MNSIKQVSIDHSTNAINPSNLIFDRLQRTQHSGTGNGAYVPPKHVPKPAKRLLDFQIRSEEY